MQEFLEKLHGSSKLHLGPHVSNPIGQNYLWQKNTYIPWKTLQGTQLNEIVPTMRAWGTHGNISSSVTFCQVDDSCMWPINFSLQIESLTITILRASWRKHVFDKGKYLVPAAMASIKSMYHVSVSSLKWMTEQFFTCFTLFRLFFFELFRVCAKADQGQIGPGPHINGLSLRQKVTNKINLEAATSAREERNTSMSTFIFAVKMQLIKKKVFFGNGRVDNKWVPWVHVSWNSKDQNSNWIKGTACQVLPWY